MSLKAELLLMGSLIVATLIFSHALEGMTFVTILR